MELSALLTKKAALIGGGTAATTTAVVVPVAVTQSNKKGDPTDSRTTYSSRGEDDPSEDSGSASPTITPKSINTLLSTSDSSIIQWFNKPGDCITRSFPGVENQLDSSEANKKGFFFRPDNLAGKDLPYEFAHADFTAAQNNLQNFDYACFMLSKSKEDNNKEFRLELVIKKENTGWLWMSGAKKKTSEENKYDFYYKEASAKFNNVWGIWIGIDGKFEVTADTDIIPTFPNPPFANLNPINNRECESEDQSCKDKEFRALLWIPDQSSEHDFLPQKGKEWAKSVLPFSDSTEDLKYRSDHSKSKRSGVYGGSTWHTSGTKQTNSVQFNTSLLDNYKGNWKDLVGYCEDIENYKSTESIYKILCQ